MSNLFLPHTWKFQHTMPLRRVLIIVLFVVLCLELPQMAFQQGSPTAPSSGARQPAPQAPNAGPNNENNNENPPAPIPPKTVPVLPSPPAPEVPSKPNNKPEPVPVPAKKDDPAQKSDSCSSGRCVPPGLTSECIMLEKSAMFSELTGYYIPLDITPFLKERFPASFKKYSDIPQKLNSVSEFLDLLGGKSFSIVSKNYVEYMQTVAGCTIPSQQWYFTFFAVDLVTYFSDKGDACSKSAAPRICASDFDVRAESIMGDINNSTRCAVSPEALGRGRSYADSLSQHKLRATTANCARAGNIESSNGRCGYFTEIGACIHQDRCPSLDSDLAQRCPEIRKNLESMLRNLENPGDAANTGESSGTSNTLKTLLIFGGVVLVFVLLGALALMHLRRTSTKHFSSNNSGRPGSMAPLAQMGAGQAVGPLFARPGSVAALGSSAVTQFPVAPYTAQQAVSRPISFAPQRPLNMGRFSSADAGNNSGIPPRPY